MARSVHGLRCQSLQECVMLYPWRVFFYRHETPNLDWNAEFRNAESRFSNKVHLQLSFLFHRIEKLRKYGPVKGRKVNVSCRGDK